MAPGVHCRGAALRFSSLKGVTANALDDLRDPDGYVAARYGHVVHARWVYSHSARAGDRVGAHQPHSRPATRLSCRRSVRLVRALRRLRLRAGSLLEYLFVISSFFRRYGPSKCADERCSFGGDWDLLVDEDGFRRHALSVHRLVRIDVRPQRPAG